jgi:enoyl-CoA hydratase
VAYEDIKLSRDGPVAIVTLDRPKVNALRARTFEDMEAAHKELAGDESVRVLVITGAGERAFSAGADLASAFRGDVKPGTSDQPMDIEGGLARFHDLLDRIEAGPRPVIAALNGVAFGGGCELALGCHYRVMDERAEIGLTETNVGIFPAGGGTQRLPRLVGLARAIDMILLGKKLSAAEALSIGLVNEVAPAGKALERALVLARSLATRPPLAMAAALEAILTGVRFGQSMGLAAERSGFARVAMTEDALEGMQAFFAKRAPEFRGR